MLAPQQQFIALSTILRRETRRFMRLWMQTLLPPVITTFLYFVIFGKIIGSRIGEMGGFSYMQFIIPGLIMMGVITNAYANVVSSFFSSKFNNSVEEMLVSPTPNYIILLGYTLGGVLRGVAVGVIVTVMSLFFIDLEIQHYGITLLVLVLTAVVFALGGFINAVFAKSFDDISLFPNFILTPLIYLGGVFYSVDLLPEFGRLISLVNPIVYMVSAFRYGILGVTNVDLSFAIGMLFLFSIGLFVFCLQLLNRGTGLRS